MDIKYETIHLYIKNIYIYLYGLLANAIKDSFFVSGDVGSTWSMVVWCRMMQF